MITALFFFYIMLSVHQARMLVFKNVQRGSLPLNQWPIIGYDSENVPQEGMSRETTLIGSQG